MAFALRVAFGASRFAPGKTVRSGRVLNVVSATPPRPACRAPCSHGHLPHLATERGEKCGLAVEAISAAPDVAVLVMVGRMAIFETVMTSAVGLYRRL